VKKLNFTFIVFVLQPISPEGWGKINYIIAVEIPAKVLFLCHFLPQLFSP